MSLLQSCHFGSAENYKHHAPPELNLFCALRTLNIALRTERNERVVIHRQLMTIPTA